MFGMFLSVFSEIIIPVLLVIYVLLTKLLLKPAMDLQKHEENPSNDNSHTPIDVENNGLNEMSSIDDIEMDCGILDEATENADFSKVYVKPNVFDLTTPYDEPTEKCKFYKVDESVFMDNEYCNEHDDYLGIDFEIHHNNDEGMWSYEDTLPILDIKTQLVHNGIIINSTIFLTDDHWHTISLVKDELYTCAVCQMYCDKEFVPDHVKMACHIANMERFRPLKMYDLNVIRKIKDILHCGICNEQFRHRDFKKHEGTKKHEQYLLYSVNKVSDIMYDLDVYNLPNPDRPFCFNTRPLGGNQIFESYLQSSNSNSQTPDNGSQTPDRDGQTSDKRSQSPHRDGQTDKHSQTLDRICQTFDRKRQTNSKSQTPDHGSQTPDKRSQTPDRICQSFDRKRQTGDCQTPDNGSQTPDPKMGQNNNSYQFNANKFNKINIYEDYSDEDIDEYTTPYEGVSYASMARKPRIELPKYLKIDLGTKEVRVKFENWHMLITHERKKFYCMVCGQADMIRHRAKHVYDEEHVNKLSACTVLEAYDDYLIRRVTDKLYHCGHCNNLQFADQIIHHIDSVHPKKNKVIDTITTDANNMNTKSNTYYDPIKPEIKNTEVLYRSVFKSETDFEVTLSPFGHPIKVSVLSYNMIVKKGEGYYCVLCECECEVSVHLRDVNHAEGIQLAPFIQPFRDNLTRAVRGKLHCTLCNMLVPLVEIYEHNLTKNHGNALAVALGIKKPHLEIPDDNIRAIVPKITENRENSTNNNFTTALRNALKLAQEKIKESGSDIKTPNFKYPQSSSSGSIKSLNEEAGDSGKVAQNKQDTSESSVKTKKSAKIDETQYPPLPKHKPHQNPFEVPLKALSIGQKSLSIGQKSLPVGQKALSLEPFAKQPESEQKPKQPLLALPAGQNPQHGQNPIQYGQKQPLLALPGIPQPGQKPKHPLLALPAGQNPPYRQNAPQHGQKIPSLLDLPFGQKPQHHQMNFQQMPLQPGQNLPPRQNLLPGQGNVPTFAHQYTGPVLQYSQSNQNRPILVPNNSLNSNQLQSFLMNPPQVPVFNTSNQPLFRFSQDSKPNTQNLQNSLSNGQSHQNSFSNGQKHQNSVLNIGEATPEIEKKESDVNLQKINPVKNNTPVKSTPVKNIIVKPTVNLDGNSDDEKEAFNELEIVLLTFKNTFYRITNLSYNTLVYIDNGIRHCFVCSMTVKMDKYQYHIDSRDHIKNMKKTKFLDKYSGQLFRQMYLMYHCAICNVMMGSKEMKIHLDWPLHSECYQKSFSILNKKTRKELKSGVKVYPVETQKEAIFHNVNEPEIKVICAYEIIRIYK